MSLVPRLYRLLSKSGKSIFQRKHKEFLVATLDVLQLDMDRLSSSSNICQRMNENPEETLKQLFRQGNKNDVDVLLSFLPRLLRYLRASKIITHQPEIFRQIHRKKTQVIDLTKSQHDLTSAAFLVSKLYYTDKELEDRNIEQLYRKSIETLTSELKKEIQELLAKRKESESYKILKSIEDQKFAESLAESIQNQQRNKIFHVLVALNRLIGRLEGSRIRGSNCELLVDQVFRPDSTYLRAMPITYSIIYCSVINALDKELNAVGISLPKRFMSRVVATTHYNTGKHEISTIAKRRGRNLPVRFQNLKSNRILPVNGSKAQNSADSVVSAHSLPGSWMCKTQSVFFETVVTFNAEKRLIEARLCLPGSDKDASLLWQFVLNGQEDPNTLRLGHPYVGTIFNSNPESEDKVAEFPSTFTFSILSSDHESLKSCAIPYMGQYLEIQVEFIAEFLPVEGTNESRPTSKKFIHHYCRSSDVDWCMLDISDQGVTPVPPTHYLDSLKRQGYSTENVKRFLNPVSSLTAASQMTGTLARSSMSLNNGSYWSAIRRFLEIRLNEDTIV